MKIKNQTPRSNRHLTNAFKNHRPKKYKNSWSLPKLPTLIEQNTAKELTFWQKIIILLRRIKF